MTTKLGYLGQSVNSWATNVPKEGINRPFLALVLPLPLQSRKQQFNIRFMKEKLVKTYTSIENAVVDGYKAIENGVVGGYKAVEGAAVGAYKAVETSAVNFGKSLIEEYDRQKKK